MSDQTIVKVLGTAQDGGVPQPGCSCTNCQAAIKQPSKVRLAASLGIMLPEQKKWYLIDATPDFKQQLLLADTLDKELTGILLTHAHIGHYTGLIFIGKEAMATQHLPVYAGERMKTILREHAPWNQLVDSKNIDIYSLASGQTVSLDHVRVTPIEVPHRSEYSETFGFKINGNKKKMLYIPDIDQWKGWEDQLLAIASEVDYCLLDATFYSGEELAFLGRDPKKIPHPYITTTMNLLQHVADQKSCDIYFLHFNHTNPVLNKSSAAYENVKRHGFHLATEGMEFEL